MKEKVIKGNISINRLSSGTIKILIQCESSRAQFAAVRIGLAEFTEALTGLSNVPASIEVQHLDIVGKTKITEKRQITCPHGYEYNAEKLKHWLLENAQEPGWFINDYLGSQGSIVRHDDATVINYRVYKYVDTDSE